MSHYVSIGESSQQPSAFYSRPYRKKYYMGRETPSLEETSKKIAGLAKQVKVLFPSNAGSLNAEESSWCQRNTPVLLTGGTITGGFLVLLVNTIISWSTQTFWHNLGQSASLGLITVGGAKAWHAYRQNRQAQEAQKEEMKRDLQIEFTLEQMDFLQVSVQTAGVAMRQDFSEFPTAYLELSLSMDKAREGIVPDDLKIKWEEVGTQIRYHDGSCEQLSEPMDIKQIRKLINKSIIPRVNHYSEQLKQRLEKLGYSSPLDVENEESGEKANLLGLSPLRDYKTGSIQGVTEKE
ncbi:MAG TPA: hypothetical protein DCE71_03000 [Parachlamydiales bacterium]|nr:hypothetical protein [Parachlamydiales bacterium]